MNKALDYSKKIIEYVKTNIIDWFGQVYGTIKACITTAGEFIISFVRGDGLESDNEEDDELENKLDDRSIFLIQNILNLLNINT